MRTERVVLFGTHFFCVLEWARFLHTWALAKMLCHPFISALILQRQKDERSKKSLKGIIPKQRTKVKGVLSEE